MSLEELILLIASVICLGIPVISQFSIRKEEIRDAVARYLSLISVLLLIVLGSCLTRGRYLLGEAIEVSEYLKWIFISTGVVLFLTLFALSKLRGRLELWTSAYTLSILPLVSLLFILYFKSLVLAMVAWILASTAGYVLVGIKRDPFGVEGAIKYSLMGTLATALFIYALALLSPYVDPLNPSAISEKGELSLLAISLLLVSISVEAGAAPFHYWLPDAYTGSQPVITAVLSTAIKMASIGLLVNQLYVLSAIYPFYTMAGFAVLSAISMTWGNLGALTQTNVQRMMAYSAIAGIGYLYVGLASYNEGGLTGVLLYLVAYILAKSSTFLILDFLLRKAESLQLGDLRGVAFSYPLSVTVLTISFLSLAGFPPLLGFWGKLYMFFSVISWAPWLTFLGIANSAISVAYYFYVLVQLFKGDSKMRREAELRDSCVIIAFILATLSIILGLIVPLVSGEINRISTEHLRLLKSP